MTIGGDTPKGNGTTSESLLTHSTAEEREIIENLRENGRPVLAQNLKQMLEDMADDPDEPPINILSLRDMASLFLEKRDYADPFISPAWGIVHTQWRIDGNGVIVWGFQGNDRILVVVQADRTSDRDALDISAEGRTQELLEDYGYLVPRRK